MTTLLMPDRVLPDIVDDLAVAYGVTSRLLLAPADEALLVELSEHRVLDTWPVRHTTETVRGVAELRVSLHEGESLAELAGDYRRLFVGPAPLVLPPYESAYRPLENLLFEVSAVEIRTERQVFGLDTPVLSRTPGDHLGLELSYLGRVCLAARDAADRGDGAAFTRCVSTHRDFLRDHLLRWAPGCLREIEAAAATYFYRGAAALGLGVLAQAHDQLG